MSLFAYIGVYARYFLLSVWYCTKFHKSGKCGIERKRNWVKGEGNRMLNVQLSMFNTLVNRITVDFPWLTIDH